MIALRWIQNLYKTEQELNSSLLYKSAQFECGDGGLLETGKKKSGTM
jgi:hypothetical protein